MARFNSTLKPHQCVVAVDHKYNDNDGAYSIAWIFDRKEETIGCVNYANGYNDGHFEDAVKDASPEEVEKAASVYRKGKVLCKTLNGRFETFLDCIVILARSRKAQNKVELKVYDTQDAHYNERYHCHEEAKILVDGKDGNRCWINESCVVEVVLGPNPWWA